MDSKKQILKTKKRMDQFNARGSRCPICGKEFRTGCTHSIKQAESRLFENYVSAIANS